MKNQLQYLAKVVLLLTVYCSLNTAFGQAPQKMSYQAVVRNTANALVANSLVGVKISVLQTTATGTVVYSERHTPTTNANGVATFEIGGGTILSGTIAGINWANGPYFIKTETDPAGGTNYTIAGTSQLASVPYALFAANSGTPNNWTTSGPDLVNNNTGNVGIGVTGFIPEKFTVEKTGIGISQQTSNATGPKVGFYTNENFGFVQTHNNFDLNFATNNGSTQMVLQKATGNLGLGYTGTLQNKFQIGNPPGFSGNDIAIGNGTQAMSLFQSPTASTFFTNTNFAFLPASGIGNVGIGVTDPQSTLTVAGSTASAIKTITSSYTATDKDHTIIVNMQEDNTRLVTISLPSAFQSIGRTYVIRGIALPNTVFGSGGLKCKYEREDNAGEDEPGADHSGYIAIRDSGGYLLTSLYKFSASQSQPLGTSDYMAGLLFPPSLLFASPQSYHAQQRTCITVQSTGVKWIVVSENFTYFRDTQ